MELQKNGDINPKVTKGNKHRDVEGPTLKIRVNGVVVINEERDKAHLQSEPSE